MVERPITPAELEQLVKHARDFAGDLNDLSLRTRFISSAFNWDRLAMKIVALADGASPARASSSRLEEPNPMTLTREAVRPLGGGNRVSSCANSGGSPPLRAAKSDSHNHSEGEDR